MFSIEFLSKYFDDFNLKARFMPSIVILLPMIPYSILNGIVDKDALEGNVINSMFFIALVLWFSNVGRDRGKRKEGILFKKWGGMPTTTLLRLSDKTLAMNSKLRYHKILNDQIDNLNLPLTLADENNCVDCTDKYDAAVDWLRNNANSNRKEFPLVYEELKSYNFSRNLYGLKSLGLLLYLILGIREIFIIKNFSFKELFLMPYPQYISFILMILGFLGTLFFVTEKSVKKRAIAYAKALIETCNKINSKETL
ncbi:hypothetical protein [Paraclostridium bifermentans]|uniref:hypothetical protein n=1 Tax=Paraclostridium bifermentans TaxID=1490 RepID=UPI0034DFABA1